MFSLQGRESTSSFTRTHVWRKKLSVLHRNTAHLLMSGQASLPPHTHTHSLIYPSVWATANIFSLDRHTLEWLKTASLGFLCGVLVKLYLKQNKRPNYPSPHNPLTLHLQNISQPHQRAFINQLLKLRTKLNTFLHPKMKLNKGPACIKAMHISFNV